MELHSPRGRNERSNTPLREHRDSIGMAPREDVGELPNRAVKEGRRLGMACVGLFVIIVIVSLILWSGGGHNGPFFVDSYVDAHGRILKQKRDGLQYFDVLSAPITLKYGEVKQSFIRNSSKGTWFDLPEDIVKAFDGKDILFTGYEGNFVTVDERGFQESVSANMAYNHHYIMSLFGKEYNSSNGLKLSEQIELEEQLEEQNRLEDLEDHPLRGDRTDIDDAASSIKLVSDGLQHRRLQRTGPDNVYHAQLFSEANGGEWRRSIKYYEEGIGQILRSPKYWEVFAHVINVNVPNGLDKSQAQPRASTSPADKNYNGILECPCTDLRHIDSKNLTIDNKSVKSVFKHGCDEKCSLNMSNNPGCRLDTYPGGLLCCEDGVRLLDKDQVNDQRFESSITVHYKFRFWYREAQANDLNAFRVFIGSGTPYTREFSIPQCKRGTDPQECVHVTTDEWPMSKEFIDCSPVDSESCLPQKPLQDGKSFRLTYINGHTHVGMISSELIDKNTGQLICRQQGLYGNSTTGEYIATELDYLVGIPPCIFGEHDGPVLTNKTVLASVVKYNSTVAHHGVMGHWQMRGVFVDPS